MESIMEQIRTRLEGEETPQELIKKGFKKTTVYSVAKKMGVGLKQGNNEKAMDRDVFLACIVRQAVASLMSEKRLETEWDNWKGIIKSARGEFKDITDRKPPEDFLTTLLKE